MHRTTIITCDVSEPPRSTSPAEVAAPAVRDQSSAELVATQRMGQVGLLAAGLAHDLNNLLTVILGSSELARDLLPDVSPARHHLHTIESTVRRAGELCRTMLACASADGREPSSVDANALVRDTVALLQCGPLNLHRVRLDLATDLPELRAHPVQFQQVVLNLAGNAAEACGPRGGRIRVSTSLAHVDTRRARQLRPPGVRPGRFLRLRVADDGCGMDEAMQQRLFTPCVTHKGPGHGLGLASVLEIARTHGGGVRVFSEPGRGTIFDAFLPLPAADRAAVTDHNSGTTAATQTTDDRRGGSILLADDEEILRHSLGAFLRTQDFAVHAVGDGVSALQHLADHPETDLLLLDLMMPKLGGLETLTALRARGNRLPVILMSGQAEEEIAQRLGGMAPTAVLAKPFSLVELMRVVGEMLPVPR